MPGGVIRATIATAVIAIADLRQVGIDQLGEVAGQPLVGVVGHKDDVVRRALVVGHVQLERGQYLGVGCLVAAGDILGAPQAHLLRRIADKLQGTLRLAALFGDDPQHLGQGGDAGGVIIGAGGQRLAVGGRACGGIEMATEHHHFVRIAASLEGQHHRLLRVAAMFDPADAGPWQGAAETLPLAGHPVGGLRAGGSGVVAVAPAGQLADGAGDIALIQMGQQPVDTGPLGQRRCAEQVLAEGLGHALQRIGQSRVHHIATAALVPFVHQVREGAQLACLNLGQLDGRPAGTEQGGELGIDLLEFNPAIGPNGDPHGGPRLNGKGNQG